VLDAVLEFHSAIVCGFKHVRCIWLDVMVLLKFLKKIIVVFVVLSGGFHFLNVGCSTSIMGQGITYPKAQNMQNYQRSEITERYGNSLRRNINSVTVIVLRGSYEEMGEAHGVLAGKEIIQLLDNIIIPFVNKQETNGWDRKVLPVTAAFTFPERYQKELISMMKGIEKKYPDRNDRMIFSLKREIKIDDLRALNCFGDLINSMGGCSSFCAWGALTENGKVICGRNLDERSIPGKIPFMVVARQPTEPGRKATVEISGPGVIGISTGMNEDGMIEMLHDGNGLPSASEKFMPRTIVMREVIELAGPYESVEKISDLFRNRMVQLGSSTHIASPMHEPEKMLLPFVVEWDGNRRDNGATVRIEDPSIIRDATVCTNHFIKRRQHETGTSKSSQSRLQRMADLLQECRASKSVISINKAIDIMDLVAEGGQVVTYLTWIAIPSDRKIIFAVTPDSGIPATRGEWIELSWEQIFGES
jgi:hypothetical protein